LLCLLQSKQTHTGAGLIRIQGFYGAIREGAYLLCAKTAYGLDCIGQGF